MDHLPQVGAPNNSCRHRKWSRPPRTANPVDRDPDELEQSPSLPLEVGSLPLLILWAGLESLLLVTLEIIQSPLLLLVQTT